MGASDLRLLLRLDVLLLLELDLSPSRLLELLGRDLEDGFFLVVADVGSLEDSSLRLRGTTAFRVMLFMSSPSCHGSDSNCSVDVTSSAIDDAGFEGADEDTIAEIAEDFEDLVGMDCPVAGIPEMQRGHAFINVRHPPFFLILLS